MAKWAVVLAEKYPGAAFAYMKAYKEEFHRIVDRLGFKVPEREMTDETCIHCLTPREPNKARASESIYSVAQLRKSWKSLGEAGVTKEELENVDLS